jgi:hypothetical protein
MHPHVRTDLPNFLTPEVAEPAKEVLACHLKDITESSSALDVADGRGGCAAHL